MEDNPLFGTLEPVKGCGDHYYQGPTYAAVMSGAANALCVIDLKEFGNQEFAKVMNLALISSSQNYIR